jgi:hypothetical protein
VVALRARMIPGLQRQRSLDFTLEGPEGGALISTAEARVIGCIDLLLHSQC